MATQLYATLKRTSKYAHQQPVDGFGKPMPFQVEVQGYDSYILRGNDNQYRLEDVNLFVKWRDGFTRIKP